METPGIQTVLKHYHTGLQQLLLPRQQKCSNVPGGDRKLSGNCSITAGAHPNWLTKILGVRVVTLPPFVSRLQKYRSQAPDSHSRRCVLSMLSKQHPVSASTLSNSMSN
jgi:hypothetical protein